MELRVFFATTVLLRYLSSQVPFMRNTHLISLKPVTDRASELWRLCKARKIDQISIFAVQVETGCELILSRKAKSTSFTIWNLKEG
jgi:hypothetical protein